MLGYRARPDLSGADMSCCMVHSTVLGRPLSVDLTYACLSLPYRYDLPVAVVRRFTACQRHAVTLDCESFLCVLISAHTVYCFACVYCMQ